MNPPRDPVAPVADTVLVKTTDLAVPPARAFALFTSVPELRAWLCEDAAVEPHVGGRYELFWDLQDRTSDSTLGCRVTAVDADRLLAFQWRSPRQFKAFANGADPLTHVVVTFHATATGTRVTLVHSGWRSSPEWQQAAQWQDMAWGHAFGALAQRVAAG